MSENLADILEPTYTKSVSNKDVDFIYESWYSKQRLNFELECQRNYIWNEPQQQAMIDTLAYQESIPMFHISRSPETEILDVVDGKQRLLTINRFIDNEFPWKKVYADNNLQNALFKDHRELYFRDLPAFLQSRIKNNDLVICTYEDLTPAGMQKLFAKLNSGQKLEAFQKAISQNINIRIHFSNFIINDNPYLENIFSPHLIRSDRLEAAFVRALALMLAIDGTGQFQVLDLCSEPLFDKNKNKYFFQQEHQTTSDFNNYMRNWEKKADFINHYIKLLSNIDLEHRSSNQFPITYTIVFGYLYDLDDTEVINLFTKLNNVKTSEITGAGTAYNKGSVQKLYRYIEENCL